MTVGGLLGAATGAGTAAVVGCGPNGDAEVDPEEAARRRRKRTRHLPQKPNRATAAGHGPAAATGGDHHRGAALIEIPAALSQRVAAQGHGGPGLNLKERIYDAEGNDCYRGSARRV